MDHFGLVALLALDVGVYQQVLEVSVVWVVAELPSGSSGPFGLVSPWNESELLRLLGSELPS